MSADTLSADPSGGLYPHFLPRHHRFVVEGGEYHQTTGKAAVALRVRRVVQLPYTRVCHSSCNGVESSGGCCASASADPLSHSRSLQRVVHPPPTRMRARVRPGATRSSTSSWGPRTHPTSCAATPLCASAAVSHTKSLHFSPAMFLSSMLLQCCVASVRPFSSLLIAARGLFVTVC